MSDPNNGRPNLSGSSLVWAIVAMLAIVVGGVVLLAFALPESQNPAALIGQLLTSFAALVAAVGAIFTIRAVAQKVDANAEHQERIERKVDDVAQDAQTAVRQTNGANDQRLKQIAYESMTKALVEHLDPGERPPGF